MHLTNAGLQVIAMILGQQQLPWECAATAEEYLKPLGGLRGIVLQLLHRDPQQRLSLIHI